MIAPRRNPLPKVGSSLVLETNPPPRRPFRDRVPTFVRYLSSGVASFVTDFSIYSLLAVLGGVDPLIAHVISRPLGGVTCYVANRTWTFRSTGRVPGEFARFWCVFLASLVLTEGLLALFCKILTFGPIAGKVLAEALAIVFNYFALKHWTFRERSKA
jgi:putative flippase GtrA